MSTSANARPTITVFTKNPCFQFGATVRLFKNSGLDLETPEVGNLVDLEVVDMGDDPDARDFVMSLGYLQAPVVFVEFPGEVDLHWSAFQPDRIIEVVRRIKP